jgi:hypothetical protein
MHQRALFVLVVLFLFSLGMYGQYQLSPENLTDRFSTSVYEILMLFLLAGEWTLDLNEIPLAIEIVRFTAPLVAITSFILVVAGTARIAVANYFLRFYRGHTIVVGLGEKSWQFLQTCEKKSAFVVVERDSENSLIGRARALGFNVLTRDIAGVDVYSNLNISHADSIIIFTNSDAENIEAALSLREYLTNIDQARMRMRVHIHLNDFSLAQQLESYPGFFTDQPGAEIYFFSVYDLTARMLLRDYPTEIYADVAGHPRVHIAIYGFGRLAEKIILESVLLFHFRNQSKLKFSIFVEDAASVGQVFNAGYPHLLSICDIEFVEQSQLLANNFEGVGCVQLSTITQHIVARDKDENNLALALELRQLLLSRESSNAPIFVRMQRSSGLAQLVHTEKGRPEIPDGIYPFGMLDQVLHVDNILSPQLDELARQMHEMYVAQIEEQETGGKNAPPSWSQLTQAERKQNLLKADHWPVRLRAIRCECDTSASQVPRFTQEEILLQATMEHNRYVDQKRSDGWRYGEVRSNAAKTNPYMVPWEQLPSRQQEQELQDVATQPAHFADSMGKYVKRRLVIGVTGHRLNKMDVHNKALQEQIRQALTGIGESHPDQYFTIMSPLAEGADRLVAKMAMEILDARLHVPLPLPYELYLSDFEADNSIEEFQRLLGLSEYYYEMPMKFGSLMDLASSTAENQSRDKQYALAGAYIVQRSDYLIAIYDGQPSAGVGGTGDVLNWFRQGEVGSDFEYRDEYFEPPERRPALIFNPYP